MLNKLNTNRESRIPGLAPRSGAGANHDLKLTILGLDPGLANLGYGVIEKKHHDLKFINAGIIKTSGKLPLNERLLKIHQGLKKLIKKYRPEIVAMEELFFCKNVKTALLVGQAIGVITLTVGQNKLIMKEYTPLEIKQTLTSYGRADKKQLSWMVKTVLGLAKINYPDHATDALACAITCAQTKPWIKN